jgi:general secretion pathway protein L
MRSLVPDQGGPASTGANILHYIGGSEPGFEVAVRHRRGHRPLGRVSFGALADARRMLRGAAPLALELPAGMLLEQEVELPIAAERELGAVLSNEMDRLTPFAADAVFWTWRVAGRDRAKGSLVAQLSVLPKRTLEPILQGLAAAGLRPAWLEAPGADGAVRRIGLASPAIRTRKRRSGVAVAGYACAGLAVIACVLPFVQQARALAATDARIEALRPRVAAVEAMRQQLAASSGGADVMASESARTGNALAALASVTQTLPDDTYLTELTLRARKLTITGRSDAAVRLIALLSSAPGLSNPNFAAPVMRMTGSHADQFSIRADIAP